MDKALLDVREAAAALGISRHTVRSWVFQRRIPFVRIGGAIRFRHEDLRQFIDAHTVGVGSTATGRSLSEQ